MKPNLISPWKMLCVYNKEKDKHVYFHITNNKKNHLWISIKKNQCVRSWFCQFL